MPLISLLAVAAMAGQANVQTVPLTLAPAGFMGHLGGSIPIEVRLSTKKPAGLNRPPAGVTAPLFGTIRLAGSTFFVVLGTFGKATHLFVDTNSDGDMTNDPIASWRPKVGQASAGGTAQVRLPFRGRRVPCNLVIVQRGSKALSVVCDFGYAGVLKLGSSDVRFFLADAAAAGFPGGKPDGSILGFDRKGNGVISGPAEQYSGALPFTINGTSLVLQSVNLAQGIATFVPGEKVAEIPLPAEMAVNQPAPTFASKSLDGKPINFPADFTGRVVLVYVWATWSQPSLSWLPRVSKVYDSFKNLGFSVLGISFNRASEGELVRTSASRMPWTTGFDGGSWSGEVARALSINTLPFVLLVNGKTGKIIATMDDLVGDRFESVIRNAVVGQV